MKLRHIQRFSRSWCIAGGTPICRTLHTTTLVRTARLETKFVEEDTLHFDYERACILGNTCWHPIVGKQCASRFIPVTRKVLLQRILEDDNFLLEGDKEQFKDFAIHLDSALTTHYKGILKRLKSLYNPLSPERDTVQMKFFTRDELYAREKSTLSILDKLLEEGHFFKLPDDAVDKALDEQNVGEGVTVKISRRKYATLFFWVVGMDVAPVDERPWYVVAGERARKKRENRLSLPDPLEFEEYRKYSSFMEIVSGLWTKIYGKQIPRVERYKRVVVAVRQKNEFKLMLKGFKDVPCENLEFLLPGGKIKMKLLDKIRFGLTGSFLVTFIIATTVTNMADFRFETDLILSCVLLLILIRNWNYYKNMRNRYLVSMSQTLYFKSVANNHAMLPLITDRAEDEAFKAAILICGVLNARQSAAAQNGIIDFKMSYPAIKAEIEKWVHDKLGVEIDFHPSSGLELLRRWDIVSETLVDKSNQYRLNNVEDVLSYLPFSKGISAESTGDVLGLLSRSADAGQSEKEEVANDRFEWR